MTFSLSRSGLVQRPLQFVSHFKMTFHKIVWGSLPDVNGGLAATARNNTDGKITVQRSAIRAWLAEIREGIAAVVTPCILLA
jgi:hypothetical protein